MHTLNHWILPDAISHLYLSRSQEELIDLSRDEKRSTVMLKGPSYVTDETQQSETSRDEVRRGA
jgi:hypothetical protein